MTVRWEEAGEKKVDPANQTMRASTHFREDASRPKSNWGLELGMRYQKGEGKGGPPQDAWETYSETLHYNRLGLDLLASVFGGFYGQSEWVDWEWRVEHLSLSPELQWRRGRHQFAMGVQASGVWIAGEYQRLETASVLGRIDTLRVTNQRGLRQEWAASPSLRWVWTGSQFSIQAEGFQWIPVSRASLSNLGKNSQGGFRWPGSGAFASLQLIRYWK
jgi:hypothetical protein